jgi:hypothetical protein
MAWVFRYGKAMLPVRDVRVQESAFFGVDISTIEQLIPICLSQLRRHKRVSLSSWTDSVRNGMDSNLSEGQTTFMSWSAGRLDLQS